MLPYYGTAIPSTCGLGSMISAGGAVRAAPTRLQTFITAGGDRRYAEPLKEQRPCPPPTEKGPYSAGMPAHVALILQTRATARRARNGLITPAPPISCCRARKCSGSRYHSKEAYLWPSSPGCVHKLSTFFSWPFRSAAPIASCPTTISRIARKSIGYGTFLALATQREGTTEIRRHRPRVRDQQTVLSDDGRRHHGRERGGPRLNLHHPPS